MTDISALHGANAAYLDEIYERYLSDPSSVPDDWARWFRDMERTSGAPPAAASGWSSTAVARASRSVSGAAFMPDQWKKFFGQYRGGFWKGTAE